MIERPTPRRKPPPDHVKVAVLLRMLGLKDKRIDWSHEPALGLRAINEAGTDWDPPQHDPEFLFARVKEEHDHITFKDNGTGRGDLTAIAHVKRVVKNEISHRAIMAAKVTGESAPEPRRKAKIANRPFPKQHRPLQSRGFPQRRRS